MKIEFKKSGLPIFNFAFWFLVISSVVFIINMSFTNKYFLNADNSFKRPVEEIKLNLEFKNSTNENLLVCFEDYCTNFDSNNFGTMYQVNFDENNRAFFEKPVKKVRILFEKNKGIENNLQLIDMHVGDKNYYYPKEEFSKFKKEIKKVQFEKDIVEYQSIELPQINNYKGVIKHIVIMVLSLFYFPQLYLIQYIWLLLASLLYIFKKDEIKIPKVKNNYWILFSIFLLFGIVARIVFINYHPLWIDEVHTKIVSIVNFKSCYSDAGNPPLFYILEMIFSKIFSNSDISLRILPCLFSIALIPSVYFLFKKIDKNLALFSTFYVAINTISIYHAQEARAYSLDMLLCVGVIYFLREYLNNRSLKNLIAYIILIIASINTNYYLCIFVFVSFIWGIFSLLEQKNTKEIKNFILVNIFSSLTIIPYLIVSFHQAVGTNFNTWIGAFGENTFKYIMNEYFLNKYVFIIFCLVLFFYLVVIYLPKNVVEKLKLDINEDKKNLFMFLIYSLVSFFIIVSIISILVKPILHKRLLLSIYPLFLILQILLISTIFNLKKLKPIFYSMKYFYSLILFFIFILSTKPMMLNEIYRYDSFINFVIQDVKRYDDKNVDIVVINNLVEEYLNNYPEIKTNKNIKWHFINTNSERHLTKITDKYYSRKKDTVIYTNNMVLDGGNISMFNPLIRIYPTNTISIIKELKLKED